MNIGVFDSGIGGMAIARKLMDAFPEEKIIVANDRHNVPYGTKTNDEIIRLTSLAIRPLLQANCKIIVVACNTATAVAIEALRTQHPTVVFIGLEPMLKPACSLTKTGVIALCATPATLKSQRYEELKAKFASNYVVVEPDCSKWAYMIEHETIDKTEIKRTVTRVLQSHADVIVLGCTHYHWIEEFMSELVDSSIHILQPTAAVIRRVAEITGQLPAKSFTDCINCSPRST